VVSTGEHDDKDVSDLFDFQGAGGAPGRGRGRREVESGFKNTGLSLYEDA